MIFDHDHPLHRTDSDLERQQRMDENRVSSDLGYPVRFGPHEFLFSSDPRRVRMCVRCGRLAEDPIHQRSEAA